VSDDNLIVATLQSHRPPPPVIQFASRDFKWQNHAELETRIRDSVLFPAHASTADGFVTQPQSVITECLDKLVPSKNMRRRARKSSAKWLSIEAVTTKHQCRQLERKRNRSGIDRQAYRVTCHHANGLINQSRRDHIRSELEAC